MRSTPHPKLVSTNPFTKYAFTFSHQSARLSLKQYESVRTKLRASIQLPAADPEARQVIIQLLRSVDFKCHRLPRIVWLTAEQWWCVSSALRDWTTRDGYVTREYDVMVTALHRPQTRHPLLHINTKQNNRRKQHENS